MNTALMFSHAKDEWATPPDLFVALDAEFQFGLDVAAIATNRKTARYLGPDRTDAWTDALVVNWTQAAAGAACFMNPPYSRCRDFIAKAATEARGGATVVGLVPARTDTRWWHDYVWDAARHAPRPGVEVRFLRGRLKFGGMSSGAPFPSVVIIFRPRGGRAVESLRRIEAPNRRGTSFVRGRIQKFWEFKSAITCAGRS